MSCGSCVKPNKAAGNTMNTVRTIGSTFACAGGRFDSYMDIYHALRGRVSRLFSVFDHRVPIQAVMLAVQKVPQK